jgi:hypothetical protein
VVKLRLLAQLLPPLLLRLLLLLVQGSLGAARVQGCRDQAATGNR